METITRSVANAIFAFFVTEWEYKTCEICGEYHHVLTMRAVGNNKWVCEKCNATHGALYRRFERAAQMFAGVRM